MARLLIIEDQEELRTHLVELFRQRGYQVEHASSGEDAVPLLGDRDYEVVLSDLRLGQEIDGLDLLEFIKQRSPDTEVIIMTAYGSVESGVIAIQRGAYDYLTKPFREHEVLNLVQRALERGEAHRTASEPVTGELHALDEADLEPENTKVIGRSTEMIGVMKLVAQVAPLDSTILVTGESGTGKDLIARALHQLSPRRDRPFVTVNCGAIPENLQESVLFGHTKGSFTGAVQTTEGLFSEANKGTLFLDEIGETALMTQVKLLRFLQSGEVLRVGDSKSRNVDVRLVAATNRDLRTAIRERRFREDLFYRLNIISIELPPLRARQRDLELLARYIIRRCSVRLGLEVRDISPDALGVLERHSWPGNVRELENAIERAVALARGPVITPADLPVLEPRDDPSIDRSPVVTSLELPPIPMHDEVLSLAEMEYRHIQHAMTVFRGNRTRVSKALGISKSTLWRKLKQIESTDT